MTDKNNLIEDEYSEDLGDLRERAESSALMFSTRALSEDDLEKIIKAR